MARRSAGAAAPWDRENPKARSGKKSSTLSPKKKAKARARARRAGRPYPNLVDNMAVASEGSSRRRKQPSARKGTAKKRTAKKSTAKKSTARKRTAKKRTTRKRTPSRSAR
jgi:hypothetical protein